MLEGTTAKRLWTVTGLAAATLAVYGLQQAPLAARSFGLASPDPSETTATIAAVTSPQAPAAQSPAAVIEHSAGPISLTTYSDRTAVLQDSDGLVHVAIDIAAKTPADGSPQQQRPTDMLVILDISGSMTGEKLEHAKQALHQLIGRLSRDDRFALLTYESTARVEQPFEHATGTALRRFRRVVDRLQTAGGTNMSAGMDLALPLLRNSRHQGRSARVLLLSDGHANEGDSSPAGLAARARQVVQLEDVMSTMGVGDDFNEDLMTALADRGTGNFYYLSQTKTLGHFFQAELRAASMTVASAVELHYAPGDGVVLEELAGYPLEKRGNTWVMRPGNLFAGQERRLWATLRVNTRTSGEDASPVKLGQFSLRYRHGDTLLAAQAPPLPALRCIADRTEFERGIQRDLWEDYVTGEEYERAQNAIGNAIGNGNAADVDREKAAFEQNRALANALGSKRVLDQLSTMESEAEEAKTAQQLPLKARTYRAKQKKAAALFERRAGAYLADPKAGL